MSSKDDKADLSNLKSRLGLNKSDGKAEKQEGTATKNQRDKAEDDSSSGRSGDSSATDKGSSGGVEDRLAALKESTRKSKQKAKADKANQKPSPSPSNAQTSGESTQATTTGGESSGGKAAKNTSGPPVGQGPPPGAQGPPPTARPSSSSPQRSSQTSERSSTNDAGSDRSTGDDADDISLSEIGIDDSSMFSGPVIGVMLALLVVGLIFGFMAAESWQTRDLEQARINDASRIHDDIGPRLDDFQQAQSIIEDLDPTRVDFEAVEELRELEFVVDGRLLPGNRILLGEEIINPLNRYMGDSSVLQQLIQEHYRLTAHTDRDILEAYQEQLDEIDDQDQIAVVFDLQGLHRHLGGVARDEVDPADYIPRAGRLVVIPDDFEELEADEDGQVEVHVLASDAPDRVDIASLVPIVDDDFLDIEPGNPMDRYGARVVQLQEFVADLESTVPVLDEELGELADSEPSPFLSLGGGDDPAEEYMEDDDAPEPDEVPQDGAADED